MEKLDEIVIELLPKDFNIDEVEVSAKSLYFIKVLKEAAKRIPQNYITIPFNYEAYYRCERKENNETSWNQIGRKCW